MEDASREPFPHCQNHLLTLIFIRGGEDVDPRTIHCKGGDGAARPASQAVSEAACQKAERQPLALISLPDLEAQPGDVLFCRVEGPVEIGLLLEKDRILSPLLQKKLCSSRG